MLACPFPPPSPRLERMLVVVCCGESPNSNLFEIGTEVGGRGDRRHHVTKLVSLSTLSPWCMYCTLYSIYCLHACALSYVHVCMSDAVLRIRNRDTVPFWPLDPGWANNQDADPGTGTNIPHHISESLLTIFWVKSTSILWCGSGSGIRNLFDFGSRIRNGKLRIQDPG